MNFPIPVLNWWRTGDKNRLRGDVVAATTLAAVTSDDHKVVRLA